MDNLILIVPKSTTKYYLAARGPFRKAYRVARLDGRTIDIQQGDYLVCSEDGFLWALSRKELITYYDIHPFDRAFDTIMAHFQDVFSQYPEDEVWVDIQETLAEVRKEKYREHGKV